MAVLKFFKVTAMPSTLEPNAVYFIQNGQYAEGYITNIMGEARALGNSVMINQIAQGLIDDALSNFNALEIVPDIPARDALAASANRNMIILVTDATGDPTVMSGAALYSYNEATMMFTKLTEYESLTAVIEWENIIGRPIATPAQIDAAVAMGHEHQNKMTLDKLSEDVDGLLFNNQPIYSRWAATNW